MIDGRFGEVEFTLRGRLPVIKEAMRTAFPRGIDDPQPGDPDTWVKTGGSEVASNPIDIQEIKDLQHNLLVEKVKVQKLMPLYFWAKKFVSMGAVVNPELRKAFDEAKAWIELGAEHEEEVKE